MLDSVERILTWLIGLPDAVLYLLFGVTAGVENLIPPIPADVMVLAGGVLAGAGGIDPGWLFVVVWAGNVGTALLVYALGRRFGARFFESRLGRILLDPGQLARLGRAYDCYGLPIIFFSRFLPVFRPVVPVFAGVSHIGFWKTAIPIVTASAVWYGLLVYIGALAGANWRALVELFGRVGSWLWIVAGILLVGFAWWWRRSRGHWTDSRDAS